MSGPMARCYRCGARRYSDDLFYSSEARDFVCRDTDKCKKATEPQNIRGRKQFAKKVSEMRRQRME